MPARVRAALLAGACAASAGSLCLAAPPAAGHEEQPGATTVFDRAVPDLPAGIRVQVVRSAADQLVLSSDIAEDVEVLGEGGEPFLRIGPAGTFANLASVTWFQVQQPEPPAAPPPALAAPARWEKVSDARSYGWFDHRLHPSSLSAPPAAEPGAVVRLGDWRVPLRVGGRPVELLGHRQLTRLAGVVTATLDQGALAGTGLVVSAASGRVPAVLLDATGAVGAGPVVVLGEQGEPMLRFTSSGTEANTASPTWGLTAAARGGAAAPSPAAEEPVWQRITDSPTTTWLEPRAVYVPGVPPEDVLRAPTSVLLGTWSLPIEQGDRRLAIRGASTWVPDPAAPRNPDGGAGRWPAAALVVGLLGACLGGVLFRRRSLARSVRSGPSGRPSAG